LSQMVSCFCVAKYKRTKARCTKNLKTIALRDSALPIAEAVRMHVCNPCVRFALLCKASVSFATNVSDARRTRLLVAEQATMECP
jgi:hypothetical protein